jgi:antitoxin YokJ
MLARARFASLALRGADAETAREESVREYFDEFHRYITCYGVMAMMAELLVRISATSGCLVHRAAGFPEVLPEYVIPNDLREFYGLCGGVALFLEADYLVTISAPHELVLSNPAIRRNRAIDIGEVDISDSWHVIGRSGEEEYFSIDLAPDRLGRCYDSLPEIHAVAGSSAIIATSFTDLLERFLANHGEHWYWEEPDWDSLGDAYDGEV